MIYQSPHYFYQPPAIIDALKDVVEVFEMYDMGIESYITILNAKEAIRKYEIEKENNA